MTAIHLLRAFQEAKLSEINFPLITEGLSIDDAIKLLERQVAKEEQLESIAIEVTHENIPNENRKKR